MAPRSLEVEGFAIRPPRVPHLVYILIKMHLTRVRAMSISSGACDPRAAATPAN